MKDKKLTCVIIDDEKSAINILKKLIEIDFPTIQVLDSANDLLSGVSKIKQHKPDFVFLDIQMPNHNGFEIVDFIPTIDFEIIFVTAYDHYAIKAFEFNAIDYLVKPVNRQRMKIAINRVEERINKSQKISSYDKLISAFQTGRLEKLILPEKGNRRVISLEKIIAIQADGSYSKIFLTDAPSIMTSKPLSYFQELLNEIPVFFRSHRSWIVNLKRVKNIRKSTFEIEHEGGLISIISRKQLPHFFDNFLSHSNQDKLS